VDVDRSTFDAQMISKSARHSISPTQAKNLRDLCGLLFKKIPLRSFVTFKNLWGLRLFNLSDLLCGPETSLPTRNAGGGQCSISRKNLGGSADDE
jgi:hypothetical protein